MIKYVQIIFISIFCGDFFFIYVDCLDKW
jgi:hypothetical protein